MKKSCSINKRSIDAYKLTVVGIHGEAFSVGSEIHLNIKF